jgi:hypothetical protein
MSTLYISEYPGLAGARYPVSSSEQNKDRFPIPPEPSLARQTVTIGAEAKSAAFSAATRFIRIHARGSACHWMIGADPTATTSETPLEDGDREFVGVTPGHKISVIAAV